MVKIIVTMPDSTEYVYERPDIDYKTMINAAKVLYPCWASITLTIVAMRKDKP